MSNRIFRSASQGSVLAIATVAALMSFQTVASAVTASVIRTATCSTVPAVTKVDFAVPSIYHNPIPPAYDKAH